MDDLPLADRILAALAETERRDRRSLLRGDELLARLDAALADVRSALYTLDMHGLVRFTRGLSTDDVVLLQPAGRAHLGLPPLPPDDSSAEPRGRPYPSERVTRGKVPPLTGGITQPPESTAAARAYPR